MNTFSQVQYLAITPELRKVFFEKLESTTGCITKLKNVIKLIDKKELTDEKETNT